MSSTEQTGRNIVSRLIDRLSKLPVRLTSTDEPEAGAIGGTTGTIYARMAAWSAVHGRDWYIEAWESPARAARYLATSICEAHLDGPQKHP